MARTVTKRCVSNDLVFGDTERLPTSPEIVSFWMVAGLAKDEVLSTRSLSFRNVFFRSLRYIPKMNSSLHKVFARVLIQVLAVSVAPVLAEEVGTSKQLIGQKEVVSVLLPSDGGPSYAKAIDYVARVDSGAATCSIHATNITEEGDQVTFTVYSDDRKTAFEVAAEIVEKRGVTTGEGCEERIKVRMQFRFGDGRLVSAKVTLNDRSHLTHGFLLGRNVLNDYWVDVTRGKELQAPAR